MNRINGMSGLSLAAGVRIDNSLSLTESMRVEVSYIVNYRIDPKTRGRIEARLFNIGRLQEFVFQLIDHIPH